MSATRLQLCESNAQPLIFMQSDHSLKTAIRCLFSEHQPGFFSIVSLGEQAPSGCMTLSEWSKSAAFTELLSHYSNEIYRHHPDSSVEEKPLHSLWSQWYMGLLIPPLLLALLAEPRGLDCHPQRIKVEFHLTGRPARFWIDVAEDNAIRYFTPEQRIQYLVCCHLLPVIEAIAQQGAINARLIWNNTGYLIWSHLPELEPVLDQQTIHHLRHHLFSEPLLADGSVNPLYRTVISRNESVQRRSCCQRYRLPDVKCCGDCTLKTDLSVL